MSIIQSDTVLRFHQMLASASHVTIVTHTKPDGDALGSSTAMYHLLDSIYGKTASIAIADQIPSNLDFLLDGVCPEKIHIHKSAPSDTEACIAGSDLIICLDFNAFHRTDTLQDVLESSTADKVLIDHHLSPDTEKFTLTFSETEISSASELLYHIMLALPGIDNKACNLPSRTAVSLMTGMTTDTNNFSNSVFPSTFSMASELIEAGVDRDFILSMIYNRFKESRVRLQGHILKDLMHITDDGVAYIVLDKPTMQRYNVEEGDTEGFVNIPLTISNVRMSILAKEDEGYARISIRSRKGISANLCSRRHFHGGGHENAAGGRIYFPDDTDSIGSVAEYIETHSHIFITTENEQNI